MELAPALAHRVYKGAAAVAPAAVLEFDIGKIKAQLGYRDVVAPALGLGAAVDWLIANRPEAGGEIERQLGDPFAYAAEDKLIEAWRQGYAAAERVAFPSMESGHMYRHPRKPGDAWAPPRR